MVSEGVDSVPKIRSQVEHHAPLNALRGNDTIRKHMVSYNSIQHLLIHFTSRSIPYAVHAAPIFIEN